MKLAEFIEALEKASSKYMSRLSGKRDFLIYSGVMAHHTENQPQSSQRAQRVDVFLCALCALCGL